MVFSSLTFLYIFLPLVLGVYSVIRSDYRNGFLFFASLAFFAWGGVAVSSVLILSIAANYGFGRLVESAKNKKLWLGVGVAINLAVLVVFKYTVFLTKNVNKLIPGEESDLTIPDIVLPIGISFYTFQAISYLIDIYRSVGKTQHKMYNLGLYISFFPQLIAGPIVRYHDIEKQIEKRRFTWSNISVGAVRFCVGLLKKVVVANTVALVVDELLLLPAHELSTPLALWVVLCYTLQIYFDFSAYSDMAIGLAKMFGFDLLENFNFPYLAKSIQDFWRRWHISLSNWFRDYLYIPLGGNRKGPTRTLINLFIVFVVTGFWHGASWNFLLWGLLHGLFLILERQWLGKWLTKSPVLLQRLYTLFVVMSAWMLFRIEDLSYLWTFTKQVFLFQFDTNLFYIAKYFNPKTVTMAVLGVLGAFGFFQFCVNKFKQTFESSPAIIGFTKAAFVVVVLVVCTSFLVANSYNPFIYFRF